MALIRLPIARQRAHQVFTTTLDGSRYTFRLSWLQRTARWIFDLETEAGTVLLAGKGLAVRADLLRQIRANVLAPPGVLMLVDLQGATPAGEAEASLDTLGDRHALFYFQEA